MKSGYRVIFDNEGCEIVDKDSGEVMNMRDDGSMFLLKLWCRKPTHTEGDAAASCGAACVAQSCQGFPRQD